MPSPWARALLAEAPAANYHGAHCFDKEDRLICGWPDQHEDDPTVQHEAPIEEGY